MIGTGMYAAVRRRYALLAGPERRRARLLLALTVCATVLEWLGGVSALAFVSVLARSEPLPIPPALQSLLGTDFAAAGVVAAGAMGLFHLGRIVALLGLVRGRARLRGEIGHSLSGRLVEAHLSAPLSTHTRRNSAERIRDVNEHAPAIWATIDSFTSMAMEIGVVAGLLLLMAAVRPIAVLATGAVLVIFVAASLRLTRRAAAQHSAQTRRVEADSLRALQQLYGAWREVQVLGRQGFFRDGFIALRHDALALTIRSETLQQMPRSILEAAFVLGACALAILSGGGASGATEAFPILALYAYSGFRAVPAAERVLSYLGLIRWYVDMSEGAVAELEAAARTTEAAAVSLTFGRAIVLDGVGYRHAGAPTDAVAEVNLTIPRGTSLAIVGRTGSGKSTLLDLVLGLLPTQHGRILIDEETLDAPRLAAWRSHIGYVPQTAFMLDDTVRRNVAFGLPDAAIDDARVTRALKLAQGWGFVSALPRGLNSVVGEHGAALSGGERQRLAIARALYRDPEVLCLDEATSALDPATERELAAAMSQLAGRTLVIVTHRLQTARRCDRVAVLARGRLVACGPWEAVLAECAELRELAAGMDAPGNDASEREPTPA